MIIVKIEIWPFGRKELKRDLATFKIINDGTGTLEKGNYKVIDFCSIEKIKEYPRKKGFLPLVIEALQLLNKKEKSNVDPSPNSNFE
jgi:hypothetical protein